MQTSCLGCGRLIPVGRKARCTDCRTERDRHYEYTRARQPHRSRAAYKTPGWQQARRVALNRANHTCQRCATNTNLQVHHVLPLEQGGTHAQDNLLVVCRACHPIVEAEARRARGQ